MRKFNSNRICSVPHCTNRAVNGETSLHSFPPDAAKKEEWCARLRICKPVTPAMRVCSAHFVAGDFFWSNVDPHVWAPRRKRLKRTAMPSQCLPVHMQGKKGLSKQQASPQFCHACPPTPALPCQGKGTLGKFSQAQENGDRDGLERVLPDRGVAAGITVHEDEAMEVLLQLKAVCNTGKNLRKKCVQKSSSVAELCSHPAKRRKKSDLDHLANTVARNCHKRAAFVVRAASDQMSKFSSRTHVPRRNTKAVQTYIKAPSVGVQANPSVQHSHVQTDHRPLLRVAGIT
ncbi:uncharacterized protein LOC119432728 isoform X2 [Dermacentor silvarum]|uniref:uncharacterized protein LOC119432728 isoform X2 n=1 Tax=Dermacentor silvarum TaxID=543639 RepID=UPI002100E816|nr:uncharacterized protein LOC119432728 isoform X2 [Dermacentor silvarum]